MTIRTGRPAVHGMFANEAAIMDLWDKGLGESAIVEATGLTDTFVEATINTYRERPGDTLWRLRARAAGEQLARACAATGQSFA